MLVKREGLLVTIDKLDEGAKGGVSSAIKSFISMENLDLQVNVWAVPDGSYTIDIYCESEVIIRRLEEFLNGSGYVLRLTPKKIMV